MDLKAVFVGIFCCCLVIFVLVFFKEVNQQYIQDVFCAIQ